MGTGINIGLGERKGEHVLGNVGARCMEDILCTLLVTFFFLKNKSLVVHSRSVELVHTHFEVDIDDPQ